MEFLDYYKNLVEKIHANSSIDLISDKEEFLEYVSDALVEAEEIEEPIEFLPFEGIGERGHKKIQIDGYFYNELDNYLSIYIAVPFSYEKQPQTLTTTEANKYFLRAKAFIDEAPFIVKTAEESAPAYGLAVDIIQKYNGIRKFNIILLTNLNRSKSIKQFNPVEVNGIPVEFQIWDVQRLYLLEESKTGKEDIIIDLKQFTSQGIPCLPASKTADYIAYLCNIPGILLAELYNKYGSRLLEGNVRSFLQTKGKVNKGIRNTILNAPDMFFAYNNGIAATASSIEIEDNNGCCYITKLTALQIVNGGQTTASLAMALLKDQKDNSEEKLKHIFVPMKLSIVSPEKAQELIPNISRYANSQNKVSDADLWSNHPFHVRMEEISRRLIAPAAKGNQFGTYWYYERANGQYKQETYKATSSERKHFETQNPKNQMFKKTDLAKYMNIQHCLPHIASAGGQKSFAKFAEWISKQWEKDDTVFNDGYFRQVVAMAILFKEADKIVKKQPWYNSYKANIVAYTLSIIIHTVKEKYPDYAIDFRSIWARQELSDAWVEQIECLSKEVYEFLVDEMRPVENVTEWAKREACWSRAKMIPVYLTREFINELVNENIAKEEAKLDQKIQKETNKINAMVDVANYGVENWKFLVEWNTTHKVLSPKDLEFIKLAVLMESGKFPSEKQCAVILQVLEKARMDGFPK